MTCAPPTQQACFADAAIPFFADCPSGESLAARARTHGLETLEDAEALQLLIARTAPARAAILSASLLARFGGLRKVLTADHAALRMIVDADTALTLQVAADAARRCAAAELPGRDLLTSQSAVTKYLLTAMAHLETEQFRVLHLDIRNQLIADEVMWKGSISHCAVYPREVIKRCLERNSSSIIIAHCHPSGFPEPSQADITQTKALASAAKLFEIKLHDHYVVGRSEVFSFRAKGLI